MVAPVEIGEGDIGRYPTQLQRHNKNVYKGRKPSVGIEKVKEPRDGGMGASPIRPGFLAVSTALADSLFMPCAIILPMNRIGF